MTNRHYNDIGYLEQLEAIQDKLEHLTELVETQLQEPVNRLMFLNEACKYMRMSRSSVYRHLQAGRISYIQVGGNKRFRKEDLDDFLNKHQTSSLPSILG